MRVLHAVSELHPHVKTGGLGDVALALPQAQRTLGVDVHVVVPGYAPILDAMVEPEVVADGVELVGATGRVFAAKLARVETPAYVVDCPALYVRDGGPYLDAAGAEHVDNHLRFASLARAAVLVARGLGDEPAFDVLHSHDWQSGLAPAYVKFGDGPKLATVLTIHNLAFQGRFPATVFAELGLPPQAWSIDGVELYGVVSFLKAGIALADKVTTVSRTYAREITEPDAGFGMDGLLLHRAADLTGIVNGIDIAEWDPSTDPFLPRRYGVETAPEGKAACKRALRLKLGLHGEPKGPLFGVVSRLTWLKGMDLVIAAAEVLAERGAELVVLGRGEPEIEKAFAALGASHPDHVAVRLDFDERLSHLMQAGADVMLVPSRSEPCGLTQLYALRYGSLPLVRETGGLADTVVNATEDNLRAGTATGLVFGFATEEALAGTIAWACDLWEERPVAWRAMQRRGMREDLSWARAAREYVALYEKVVGA